MRLQLTLLLNLDFRMIAKPYVHIIVNREDHWVVASTLFSRSGQVKVYDSVSTTIDKEKK